MENTAKLLDSWQPQEGIEVLIDRFNKTKVNAFFSGTELNDKTLITYFLIPIKRSGMYKRAYEDWLAKDDAQKTFANLKEFWRTEHMKMKRGTPSARQYEFGMNAKTSTEPSSNQPDVATILE